MTYSHQTIARFTRIITVLLACMLPIGAIMLLYWVRDMTKRLGLIACFTGVFSISMNIFTMATLSEIFAATAAYVHHCNLRNKYRLTEYRFAAVLVVFLSATNGV